MIRVLRYFLLLVLFLFARALLRSLFAGVRQAGSGREPESRQSPASPVGGELKKDPVCGTYVAAIGSLTRTVNGQVFYFCSADCRDKYAHSVSRS